MKNDSIREYCINLILKSKASDWKLAGTDWSVFTKDNFKISMVSWGFIVKIYDVSDINFRNVLKEYDFQVNNFTLVFNNLERNQKKSLKEKYKYLKMMVGYDLLPVKEIRKLKLKNIKK